MKRFLHFVLATVVFCSAGLNVGYANTAAHPAEAAKTTQAAPAEKININTATAEQLEALKGIGKSKAEAVVSYRNEHGKFAQASDLSKVKGIGDKLAAKIADQVVF